MSKCSKIREAWASGESATHPSGGGPFSFFAANSLSYREGAVPPAAQRMNNFLPGKTSYGPQWACRSRTCRLALL
jgi:hypothetical protein